MQRTTTRQHGFTILELMVATAVFSVILLIVAIGAISFTNSYYKGVTSSKTQAVARSIMSNLVQAIQFGQLVNPNLVSGNYSGICVDNTLYSFVLGQQVTDSLPFGPHQAYHGLIESTGNDCSSQAPIVPNSSNPLPGNQRELLGQHMRLGALSVTPAGSLYTVRVRVIYGDDDLLTSNIWATALCAGNVTGSDFCAVSDLTTTVGRRLL